MLEAQSQSKMVVEVAGHKLATGNSFSFTINFDSINEYLLTIWRFNINRCFISPRLSSRHFLVFWMIPESEPGVCMMGMVMNTWSTYLAITHTMISTMISTIHTVPMARDKYKYNCNIRWISPQACQVSNNHLIRIFSILANVLDTCHIDQGDVEAGHVPRDRDHHLLHVVEHQQGQRVRMRKEQVQDKCCAVDEDNLVEEWKKIWLNGLQAGPLEEKELVQGWHQNYRMVNLEGGWF